MPVKIHILQVKPNDSNQLIKPLQITPFVYTSIARCAVLINACIKCFNFESLVDVAKEFGEICCQAFRCLCPPIKERLRWCELGIHCFVLFLFFGISLKTLSSTSQSSESDQFQISTNS